MRVALSIMLMQECCNFIRQWENEPGGVPIRIKHLFYSPYLTLTRVISLIYTVQHMPVVCTAAIYWNITTHLDLSLRKAVKGEMSNTPFEMQKTVISLTC